MDIVLWVIWTCTHRVQLAVEYENNAMIVKVDTDDEYEFARDMQVTFLFTPFVHSQRKQLRFWLKTEIPTGFDLLYKYR